MAEASRNNTGVGFSAPVSAFESFVSKHFVRLLVGIAAGGGALAFLVPWLLYIAGITGEADVNLRLHILYVTGGIIAVLGLVETRHKNTTDRAKALSEQARQFNETIAKEREKIEADKAKNEQNHIRQVHAERRSRYIAAIEQLSNRENATTRFGGVYALIGLIDEWLADGALLTDKERRKEGQVIINSLCAYIRSPFPLAERAEQLDGEYTKDLQNDFRGDTEKFDADKRAFTRDKAVLEEERQIRQNIIKEMCEHLLDAEEPGTWSVFDYNFSNAYFFYPVDFSDSHFGASLDFTQATFTEKADFFMAAFAAEADFSKAAFIQDADFYGVKFTGDDTFSRANFTEGTEFFKATFTGDGTFHKAKFNGPLLFSRALFMRNSTFSKAKFAQEANFFMTVFTKEADFSGSKFSGHTSFFEVKFSSSANFFKTKFAENTRFSGAQFNGPTNFSRTIFHSKPEFANTPNKNYKAKFSHKAAPADYSFKTAAKSPYKIDTREQEHNGVKLSSLRTQCFLIRIILLRGQSPQAAKSTLNNAAWGVLPTF